MPSGVDSSVSPFQPYPGLANPHAQTLAARLIRARFRTPYSRTRLATPDGDFIDLDMAGLPDPHGSVCLILHGLEGSSGSGYVLCACRALERNGIAAVAMNFRSCSGEPNRTPQSYHAGKTDDIELALDWLARQFPNASRGVLGFSLGGNALLKYLGEAGEAAFAHVDAAVTVSVPFDLASSAQAMERGAGRIYARHFLRSMRRKVREKAGRFPDAFDLAAVHRAQTLWAFDEAVTAPIHGFPTAADYYDACSSRRFMDSIRVPTALVQSRDDPLVPADTIPWRTIDRNGTVSAVITEWGGHVGFLTRGVGPVPRLWAEEEAARLLRRHLAQRGT
jgi:predicted alpha/beta-fold hydrolase